MPRFARIIPPQGYMHVISRGNNKLKIFKNDKDRKRYYSYLLDIKYEERIEIYHYCLMNNHVHLLLGVLPESHLSRFMKRINLKYTCYYARKYSYVGHLWQGRFKAKIIDNDSYLIQCGKYIELNPLRAGVVDSPGEYKFSSYHYYAEGKDDILITQDPLYENLGKDKHRRKLAYRGMITSEFERSQNLEKNNCMFVTF